MLKPRIVVWLISAALIVLGASVACGQDYPNKTIRIFTAGLGGAGDYTSRLIAPAFSARLGQPVVIENRAGVIANETVAKAPPDGYTLLINGNAMWIGPLLQKVNYDPVSDFSPIALMQTYPTVLFVHPSLPVKSVKELIALAKAKPGALNYGTSTIGGGSHLAMELFKSMAGVNIVLVPYSNVVGTVTAVMTGEVQVAFAPVDVTSALIKAGRLRALAINFGQPSALAPGLPTVAATGLPGYEAGQYTGMFAPAKTPQAIINRLNQEIVRVLTQPDLKEKFFNTGSEAVSSSPEEFAALIKSDMAKMAKVIKDAGIH